MPKRRLINKVFIHLALEAGIDSGIIDPLQTDIASALDLDTSSEAVGLTIDMLLGRDDFCMNYIQAFRDGRLAGALAARSRVPTSRIHGEGPLNVAIQSHNA